MVKADSAAVFFLIITSHDTLSYSRYSLSSPDALICFHGAAASASAHPSERAPGRQSARRPCAVLCLWREDALRKLAGNQVRGADAGAADDWCSEPSLHSGEKQGSHSSVGTERIICVG